MRARGSCAVLKLRYKLHGRGDENGTAYTAIFFNGSTRGKYYKSLGSAAHYAAYFKQADEAAGTGLGTELFVRGRNFALTEAGMLLRRRAEEVVDMMYKIESEIETAGEVGGVISIGSGAACGLTIEGAVDLFEDSKMVFKPLNPRLELTAVLAWKRFHSLSGAAAKFLEYFKEYLKSA